MKKSSKILLLVITVITIIMAMAVTASADAGSDPEPMPAGKYWACIEDYEEKTCSLWLYRGEETDVLIPTELCIYDWDGEAIGMFKVVGIYRAECFSSTSSYVEQGPPVITSFKVESDNKVFTTIDGVLFSKDKKTLIRYPEGKKDTSYTIPSTVTTISVFAFHNCSYLENITIPDSVTSIKSSAFANSAIYNNENNWENDVLYIGNALIVARSDVSGSYTIKTGTKLIAENTFSSCTNLTEIIVPASVCNITAEAFTEYKYIYGNKLYQRIKTIVGYNGTSAEIYANEYGHPFTSLGGPKSTYTGLYKYGDLWCYVEDGKVDYDYTGLAKYNGKWYYVEDGVKDSSFTGLCKYGKSWYYVKKGVVDKSYTGLAKRNGKWYHVSKGVVDFDYTGLSKYGTKWYYVENGKLDKTYTGLCKYSGKWYYVEDGVVDKTYTGLCKHSGAWYYVKKGVVDFTYTGLCKYNSKWYYVNKGKVDFTYTGYATYNGKKYKVVKGVKV